MHQSGVLLFSFSFLLACFSPLSVIVWWNCRPRDLGRSRILLCLSQLLVLFIITSPLPLFPFLNDAFTLAPTILVSTAEGTTSRPCHLRHEPTRANFVCNKDSLGRCSSNLALLSASASHILVCLETSMYSISLGCTCNHHHSLSCLISQSVLRNI